MKKMICGLLLMSLGLLSYAQKQETLYQDNDGEILIKQGSFVNALGRDGLEFNAITVIFKEDNKFINETTYRAYATSCKTVQGPLTETSSDGKKLIDFVVINNKDSPGYSILKGICDNYSIFKVNPEKFNK